MVFCPYDSAPYKEKWTLFSSEEEFNGSENQGFLYRGNRKFTLRYLGKVFDIVLGESGFNATLEALLETIITKYGYLLKI
jgi:putative selenate reductase